MPQPEPQAQPAPAPPPAPVEPASFVEVSYSVTGSSWNGLGKVSQGTWGSYSADIPVHSWQDLQNLQLSIAPLPSLDLQPTIYLDGMTVTVDYDRTLGEAITDLGNTFGDIAAAALEAVTNTTQDLVATVQQTLQNVVAQPESPPAPVAAAPEPPAPPVPVAVPTLMFTVGSSVQPANVNLPWLSVEDVAELGGAQAISRTAAAVPATAGPASPSAVVHNDCRKAYGVVLMYRHSDDYLTNPSTFVFNRAVPCSGGSFSYDLKQLPIDFVPGTYYLLTAEEGETGPWLPVSGVVPVTIELTTVLEPPAAANPGA